MVCNGVVGYGKVWHGVVVLRLGMACCAVAWCAMQMRGRVVAWLDML